MVAVSARPITAYTMESLLIGLLALGCLGYLLVAVLRPEKF